MQVETGITKQETTKWLREIPPCTLDSLSSSTFSVNFDDIASAFLVLVVGIIVSLVFLFVEILVHAKSIKNAKKRIEDKNAKKVKMLHDNI